MSYEMSEMSSEADTEDTILQPLEAASTIDASAVEALASDSRGQACCSEEPAHSAGTMLNRPDESLGLSRQGSVCSSHEAL